MATETIYFVECKTCHSRVVLRATSRGLNKEVQADFLSSKWERGLRCPKCGDIQRYEYHDVKQDPPGDRGPLPSPTEYAS